MPDTKHVLILSDNTYLIQGFQAIIKKRGINADFTFRKSPERICASTQYSPKNMESIDVNKKCSYILKNFDLVLSVHSKQIFPKELVYNIKCINIHPGYNPYNRGWFPQVFSIMNGMPIGVTIHEMDEKIDHGNILYQEMVPLESYDDSLSAYRKILNKELEMIDKYIMAIIDNTYTSFKPDFEGNINFKKDYQAICALDMTESMTMAEAINRLRALTHGEYDNAYFIDEKGRKIYVKVSLHPAI